MLKFLAKRIVLTIPTLFLISAFSFILLQAAPGNPVEQKAQEMVTGQGGARLGTSFGAVQGLSASDLQAMKKQYGIDRPLLERYEYWLGDLIHANFGTSRLYQAPALAVILRRAPLSLSFGAAAFFISYALAILFSLIMASHEGLLTDRTLRYFVIGLSALPVFMIGILLLLFLATDRFAIVFPLGFLHSENYAQMSSVAKLKDLLWHVVLPLACYVFGQFSALSILGRNTMLEECGKDYVRTARAKGVSEIRIFSRHVLRNSLIPMVTGLGGTLAAFLGGSVLVESVFQLRGLGQLGLEAIMNRDINLVMALLFSSCLVLLFGNLLSDTLYMLIDPRVRLK